MLGLHLELELAAGGQVRGRAWVPLRLAPAVTGPHRGGAAGLVGGSTLNRHAETEGVDRAGAHGEFDLVFEPIVVGVAVVGVGTVGQNFVFVVERIAVAVASPETRVLVGADIGQAVARLPLEIEHGGGPRAAVHARRPDSLVTAHGETGVRDRHIGLRVGRKPVQRTRDQAVRHADMVAHTFLESDERFDIGMGERLIPDAVGDVHVHRVVGRAEVATCGFELNAIGIRIEREAHERAVEHP